MGVSFRTRRAATPHTTADTPLHDRTLVRQTAANRHATPLPYFPNFWDTFPAPTVYGGVV
jgi:hypothetical protein